MMALPSFFSQIEAVEIPLKERLRAALKNAGFLRLKRQKRLHLLVRQHEATLLGGVTDLGLGDLLVASTIERRIDGERSDPSTPPGRCSA
jgi:hypothetical protein